MNIIVHMTMPTKLDLSQGRQTPACFNTTTMAMCDRDEISTTFLAKRIHQLPNPLYALDDIFAILFTIEFPRMHISSSGLQLDEGVEQPLSLLESFKNDFGLFDGLKFALLDYLASGIDPLIVLNNGILGSRVVRAILEARHNKTDGEAGLAYFYGITVFDAINQFIWLDEPRNHRWVIHGVSRRAWRPVNLSAGTPPAFKFVVDGLTRVVFFAKPIPDKDFKAILLLINKPNGSHPHKRTTAVLSVLNQVSDVALVEFYCIVNLFTFQMKELLISQQASYGVVSNQHMLSSSFSMPILTSSAFPTLIQ